MKLLFIRRLSFDQLYFILSLVASAAYFAMWTYIDYLQYMSLNLHIWDVGINFFLPYQTSQLHFNNWIPFASEPFQPQKLDYFLLVPLVAAFPSPLTIVVAELFTMSIAGPFLFLVSRKILNDNIGAILLTLAYLFNYSLFGAAFFPSHYQTFFTPFFIIAIYFYITSKRLLFSVFILLSAMASLLGAITIILFMLLLTAEAFTIPFRFNLVSNVRNVIRHWRKNLHIPILLLSTLMILVGAYLYYGSESFLSGAHLQSSGGLISGMYQGSIAGIQLKIVYLVLVLFPFGFVIFSSRYSFLLTPFFLLILSSAFDNYKYFAFQYTYVIGTILFLAYADGLRQKSITEVRRYKPGKVRLSETRKRIVLLAIIVVILDIFILPYGPLNQYAGNFQQGVPFWNYGISTLTHVTTNDIYVSKLINLIPIKSSALIQENMPQLTNRQMWFEPGMYNGTPYVEYVITDPYSPFFSFTPPSFIGPYPKSMESWFNELFSSGNYGIYANLHGNILLKRGYYGQPIEYIPYGVFLSYNYFVTGNGSSPLHGQNFISVRNEMDYHFSFNSQHFPFLLPPGKYKLTFLLSSSSDNNSSTATVGISSLNGSAIAAMPINGSIFTGGHSSLPISFTFVVRQYYTEVDFAVYNTHWAGTLNLYGAYLNQTSP